MGDVEYTPDQRRAIETVDRSVLVSAAAGSGKTAVLAGRAAHLLCDAPASRRCTPEQLLVVTFTEAAAAQMKERIAREIRRRLTARPGDDRLRIQLALLDTAQISTIHAFCRWMIRRWFSVLGVDPAAPVLDADEARLLRRETIERLFAGRYRGEGAPEQRFKQLVDVYGLGQDERTARLVLRLADFADSLADPDAWLDGAVAAVSASADGTIDRYATALGDEVAAQAEHCALVVEHLRGPYAEAGFYADRIADYAAALRRWAGMDDLVAVRQQIVAYQLTSRGAPALKRGTADAVREARDAARAFFKQIKEQMFERRLRDRFGRFTAAELREGLERVAPFVETIVELVRAFRERYARRKADLAVLDFNDLERGAYRLLSGAQPDVVAQLRDRFRHVLVDEFQDTSPLQDAILRAVSREDDTGRDANLFAVGDIKQSIYRFRLAEPHVFLDRLERFAGEDRRGTCVHLPVNYRSRAAVLDGVNLLFGKLMRRDTTGIDYDERARLQPGRTDAARRPGDHVELHILPRRLEVDEPHHVEDARVDPLDPVQWVATEREALLIGHRIRALIEVDGLEVEGRPLRYGDVAVLLRAATHTAGAVVDVLARMNVPAYAETTEGMFEALEVRDVLALLNVLDNAQQDIPLAAVLRSRVTGDRLTDDELVEIRCFDRQVPFHEAVRRFAVDGPAGPTRDRLSRMLNRLERFRREVRRRPVADVLWKVYADTGYLAYVGGLPGGARRRANLLMLHERARQFASFQRQGLHRFLRFIDALREQGADLGVAPAVGEGHDAVRVMSIHHSKGLEFPVVFVADLGRSFNLTDARERMIFDRQVGIGLRAVDPERMIEYPTALHHLVVQAIDSATKAEELRVLYVALTRAQEKLILVGTARDEWVDKQRRLWHDSEAPTTMAVNGAQHPLEWIVAALACASEGAVQWDGAPEPGERSVFHVVTHDTAAVQDWRVEDDHTTAEHAGRFAATLAPLPADEPVSDDADAIEEIIAGIDYSYPHLEAASVRAVISASEARGAVDVNADPDEQPRGQPHYAPSIEWPAFRDAGAERVRALRRGTATHLLLERLDASRVDAQGIGEQMRRLIDQGLLDVDDVDTIDTDAIAWFFTTPLGRMVRAAGDAYHREFRFLALEPARRFDPTLGNETDEGVLVRGIIDGLLETPAGLEVIDFKTDRVATDELDDRAAHYDHQLALYAAAAGRLWDRPVAGRRLVFFYARRIVDLPGSVPLNC